MVGTSEIRKGGIYLVWNPEKYVTKLGREFYRRTVRVVRVSAAPVVGDASIQVNMAYSVEARRGQWHEDEVLVDFDQFIVQVPDVNEL